MFGTKHTTHSTNYYSELKIVKHRGHVCLSHAELGAGVAVVVQRLANLQTGHLNGRQNI